MTSFYFPYPLPNNRACPDSSVEYQAVSMVISSYKLIIIHWISRSPTDSSWHQLLAITKYFTTLNKVTHASSSIHPPKPVLPQVRPFSKLNENLPIILGTARTEKLMLKHIVPQCHIAEEYYNVTIKDLPRCPSKAMTADCFCSARTMLGPLSSRST